MAHVYLNKYFRHQNSDNNKSLFDSYVCLPQTCILHHFFMADASLLADSLFSMFILSVQGNRESAQNEGNSASSQSSLAKA